MDEGLGVASVSGSYFELAEGAVGADATCGW